MPTRRSTRSTRAQRWFVLRVVLHRHGSDELLHPPGRDLLASGSHQFADLASAIDGAFARWDPCHLHEFQLADGRRVSSVDDDLDDVALVDERTLSLGAVMDRIGTTFAYVFDIGEGWEHECTYLRDADLEADFGGPPSGIVPIFGWGSIPDQYGRVALRDEDDWTEPALH